MAVKSEEGKQAIRHDKYNGSAFKITRTEIHKEVLYTAPEARFAPTCSA
jgi:hypothetical protein